MNDAEMGALRQEAQDLECKLSGIKVQLANARLSEDRADRDWYRRAVIAEKITAQRLNSARHKLGQAERELRRQRNDSRERAFVAVAKRVLAEETYKRIWAEVDGEG